MPFILYNRHHASLHSVLKEHSLNSILKIGPHCVHIHGSFLGFCATRECLLHFLLIILIYSLVNIYKALTNDIEGFQAPKHGYLMGWAKQGELHI